ncbi:MAG TPA: aldehyde dehydrogenase (NADP(+)) [Actinophytocola sp.]|uniref:aldehyde dehydrogenase (NADP(+)) n=1 Tax=Actinophytocola sp. TaxID=1872138 RepID=UPI002DDCAC59|nr:aldehyde dehydrogenase (NADP(+)) [Actinophytocola sp.]HEV2784041.1 aldehyde dehydrogenase (NADP(+)) [Actinophytocola sp.]
MSGTPQSTMDTELDAVLAAAWDARAAMADLPLTTRADAMRAVADALDAAAGELVPVAGRETKLAEARLSGELARTTFQLRLLADVTQEGGFLEATIDPPDPDWPPAGRPDLRRMLLPVGPVAVYSASNFPFAFSVAGGDTAAALAAGCPVVLKAHSGHPELSRQTGAVVAAALAEGGAPKGAFAVVYGQQTGRTLIQDPRIKAGAFTGSLTGGRALFDLACARPDPIPFYAEMGSVNPVFVTEAAATARAAEIADGYVGSYTLGAGQFCTKPGLLFVPDTPAADEIERRLTAAVAGLAEAPLLNDRIAAGYTEVLQALSGHRAIRVLHAGRDNGNGPSPTLLGTTAADLLATFEELTTECFGPTSIVVRYTDEAELLAAARMFPGQLTATVHGEDGDPVAGRLFAELTERAGRVLWNGWPTGVAVSYAMHHGGPYPATSMPAHTSVGTTSIRRFQRPVCYQNVPQHLLPEALRDGNPLGIPQRVNGVLVLP